MLRSSRFGRSQAVSRRSATTTERAGPLEDLVAPPYDVIGAGGARRVSRAQPVQRRPSDAARQRGGRRPGRPVLAGRGCARRTKSRPSGRFPGLRRPRRRRADTDRTRRVAAGRAVRERRRPPARAHARAARRKGGCAFCARRGPNSSRSSSSTRARRRSTPPGRRARPRGRGHASLASRGRGIGQAFADRRLLIADGHHRYETALAYHEEVGTPESGYMMVVLVSTADPGLMIFPTHRLAASVDGPSPTTARSPRRSSDLEHEPSDRAAAVALPPRGPCCPLRARRASSTSSSSRPRRRERDVHRRRWSDAVAAVDRGEAEGGVPGPPARVSRTCSRWPRGARRCPRRAPTSIPSSSPACSSTHSARDAVARALPCGRRRPARACSRACRRGTSASQSSATGSAETTRPRSTRRRRRRS